MQCLYLHPTLFNRNMWSMGIVHVEGQGKTGAGDKKNPTVPKQKKKECFTVKGEQREADKLYQKGELPTIFCSLLTLSDFAVTCNVKRYTKIKKKSFVGNIMKFTEWKVHSLPL